MRKSPRRAFGRLGMISHKYESTDITNRAVAMWIAGMTDCTSTRLRTCWRSWGLTSGTLSISIWQSQRSMAPPSPPASFPSLLSSSVPSHVSSAAPLQRRSPENQFKFEGNIDPTANVWTRISLWRRGESHFICLRACQTRTKLLCTLKLCHRASKKKVAGRYGLRLEPPSCFLVVMLTGVSVVG